MGVHQKPWFNEVGVAQSLPEAVESTLYDPGALPRKILDSLEMGGLGVISATRTW